jgi:hypothetical protein
MSRTPFGRDLEATPGVRRRIAIEPNAKFRSYVDYQALYMDQEAGRLIPNTEVWRGSTLEVRINALGCKGPDVDLARPQIAFFGDSTTMGIANDAWAFHVAVDGYGILNAGIEGMNMARIADRYEELARQAPLAAAVACAGWHNLVYNESTEEHWEQQLSRFLTAPIAAFWTLPTCLTEDHRRRGVASLINTADGAEFDGDYFNFWVDMDAADTLVPLLDAIGRYNAFIVDFCRRHDAVLVDVHELLRPTSYETSTRDFFDVCHLRPRAYQQVGAFVGDVLRDVLPPADAAPTTTPAAVVQEAEREDLRKNIYPLW